MIGADFLAGRRRGRPPSRGVRCGVLCVHNGRCPEALPRSRALGVTQSGPCPDTTRSTEPRCSGGRTRRAPHRARQVVPADRRHREPPGRGLGGGAAPGRARTRRGESGERRGVRSEGCLRRCRRRRAVDQGWSGASRASASSGAWMGLAAGTDRSRVVSLVARARASLSVSLVKSVRAVATSCSNIACPFDGWRPRPGTELRGVVDDAGSGNG